MGWLAAGCCTVIAGYVLYKFYARGVSSESHESPPDLRSKLLPPLQSPPKSIPAPSEKSSLVVPGPPVLLDLPAPTINPPLLQEPVILVGSVDEAQSKEMVQPLQEDNIKPLPPSIRSSSPPRLKPPTFGSMAAPPRPGNGLMRPPPSAAASLRVPPQKALPNTSMAPTSSIMPPGKQVSRKVNLEPGHSPLDWAALTSDPSSRLRGKDAPDNLIRVTPEQLKRQNGRKGRDAWTVYHGKVYNITPYVSFHPGGAGEILRGAGKDSVKLFMEVHPWVNWDGMLSECMVGILVGDEDAGKSSTLDEMD